MAGCEGYQAIAGVYDRLNAELDYHAWADFIESAFSRFLPQKPELVLDLACGTGRMTRELAARGYDMIGIDGSEEMLAEAYRIGSGEETPMPLYLCQDMRAFELYGTVGAVVCCLDSLNYLLTEADLAACFALVHNYLDPDGVFLFDMNTPFKFETVYGDNAYVLEDEDAHVFCGWQNHYDAETGLCDFDLSVFEETADGTYRRADEHQCERCYPLDTVKRLLTENGFAFLGAYGDEQFGAPLPNTERWYVAARCRKEGIGA